MPRASTRLLIAALPVLLVLGLLASWAAPAATSTSAGMSAERLDRLTEALQSYVDDGALPGAVALVQRRGRVAYLGAFGYRDREAQVAATTDDIFRIASQTKALVSVAIMMLQEEGKLLISHPVERYLPSFAETTVAVPVEGGGYDVVAAARDITLRDLLTHTAGIGYGSGAGHAEWAEAQIQGWYFADRAEPIGATVARMAALPMDAQPGEHFVYGYSTDILGHIVEVVSEVSLEAFLQERILDPLGMVDTHFYLPPDKVARLTTVYSATDEGLVRAPDPGGMVGQGAYVDGPRTSFSGGAGLLSTARDYARFLQMMLNEGELDGVRILSEATVELMTVNHVGERFTSWSPGYGFGLGFSVLEDLGEAGTLGSAGAFGWGGAYHSTYWVDPEEDLVVVYFTQLIPADDLDDHAKLRALVYQAIQSAE